MSKEQKKILEKKPAKKASKIVSTEETDWLFDYLLHLADNTLILGHRNSEWTGHGPILEQDIAISNIALDLVGQARNFYQYAANLTNTINGNEKADHITEDTLAYHRDGWDFKNCLLVEQPNGDWAKTILRQFYFSLFQFYLYEGLTHSKDRTIAAISEKAIKEVAYHLRWSSEWVIRLGDGTEESNERMNNAIRELSRFTDELFSIAPYEKKAIDKGIAVDVSQLKSKWLEKVKEVFDEATLTFTDENWKMGNGKEGKHTEHLGYILAEMQFLQRVYPGCEW